MQNSSPYNNDEATQTARQEVAQKEVVQQEQEATNTVAYCDEHVARQIHGTTNVGEAVQDAEKQAFQAVSATQ